MGRKKVKLAFILKDAARKATYKKRVKGFLKKLDELTTLCDVQACALVYNPDDPQPAVIWPSHQKLVDLLIRYMEFSDLERNRRTLNMEAYLMERIEKMKQKAKKMAEENRRKEMTLHLYQYLQTRKLPDNLSHADTCDLINLANEKIKELDKRMEELNIVQE